MANINVKEVINPDDNSGVYALSLVDEAATEEVWMKFKSIQFDFSAIGYYVVSIW
jgi:hypothetical protein